MPITTATQPKYDIVDDSDPKNIKIKFRKGVIYNTLIQEGKRYVITRDHEPIEFEHTIYKKMFKRG